MKKLTITLMIFICVDLCFGIDQLKLYRDDIDVIYPEKAKKPLAVSECRPSPELKKDRPKKQPSFDEISVAIVRELEESVAATMKSASESAIPIPSVITGEFILEGGNTYHATTDVTIPANQILRHEGGAVVEWAAGCGLLKEPDGIYISRGKPWAMCVHVPDSNSPSPGYWDGIRLEGGTARDSVSEVTYTYAAYAEKAVTLSDITLNRFFENNFFEFNNSGIVSYGPRQTKITNNVCYWNSFGIDAVMENESGIGADPNYVIEIVSNTCHENNYGILLSGTSLENALVTIMDKNISTASAVYNYSLWAGNLGGYFYPIFTDNGRWLKYGGSANTNYDPLSWEYNPVEVFSDPYDPGPGYFDIVRLRQDCAFVDGSTYSVVGDSPQVGFTTSKNNEPDRGDSDLGFHYSNWDYSNTGDPNVVCDFDGDNYVGMGDLVIVANYWLEYCTDANCPDVDDSNDINLSDFARLSQDWQKTTGSFPSINVSFSDGEDGDKIVRASGYDESIYRMFLFVDGYFIREIFLEPGPISTRQVFVPWLKAGIHQAKIIAFDLQGNIICGPVQDFPIAEGISGCDVPRFFGKGKPLPFIASSSLGDVEVKAWYEGSVVWSQIFSDSLINGEVPTSVTNDYEFECLQFVPVQMMKASGSSGVAAPTAAADEDFDGYRALMVRPDFRINWSSGLADHVYDMLDQMGYKTKKLTCFTSTHSKIKKYKDKGRIEVLYFTGHSNYIWGGVQVSVQELDDCIIVSDKVSNYTPQSSAPSWLTLMEPEIERSVKTWKEIGFDRLRFAAFDACYALRNAIEESTGDLVEDLGAQSKYRGDLSEALNLGQDCFLYGWSDYYHTGFLSEFEQFSSNLWTRFEAGDTLYEAIQYCIDHGDPYEGQDPRVEYRIHGVGDMFNFEL